VTLNLEGEAVSGLDTKVLPLLPLTTGVVLPGMVVTLTIESEDARRAVSAAQTGESELLLVPRIDERYARVGTVGSIEDVGRLQNGMEALVIRGLHRAIVSQGVPGTGDAIWVQVDPVHENTAPRSRASSRRAASRSSPTCCAA
jgi:ATP-dependent Lon protease